MDLGLRGRKAIVAAGTSGLGFACAAALVAEGVQVALCGSRRETAQRAADELGEAAVGLEADLRVPDECERFVTDAAGKLGGADILVVNGPGPPPGTAATTEERDYQAALETSLLSVVRMCSAAVPIMRTAGWGRIVAVTSVAVRQPIGELALSNTARAGATGYLKSLAREVAEDGVTINSVQPGLHDTARVRAVYGDALPEQIAGIPVGSLGEPADFGAVVAFLCSEYARYVTGVGLPVDGGVNQGLF